MNSTNADLRYKVGDDVWEICKFWILQTIEDEVIVKETFERYVNFEFYKQDFGIRWNPVGLRDM